MTFKKFCLKEKNNFWCGVKVDTGFSRRGLTMDEMEQFKNVICDLNTSLIISHLACAEEKDHPKNEEQLKKFLKIKNLFGDKYKYSLSATGGVFLGKNFHFDIVRVGYGIFCNDASKKLKNAISVYAKILQVKNIKKGDTVGYGCTFVAKNDMKIAVLGIGYALGLFKNLKDNKYWAWVNGQKCNLVGKISMEYSIIDVTDIYDKYLQIGAPVELLGEHRTLVDMALELNTNPGDVTQKFGKLEKFYLNN
jgi:alanine racemase